MKTTITPPAGYYVSPMLPGVLFKRRDEAPSSATPSYRTTAAHRAAVEKWRKTAPANDSEIFGKKPKTEAPRHRDLGAMNGLLAFRNRPTGAAEGSGVRMKGFSALATNWSIVPTNDNVPTEDGFGNEREVQYEPSIQLIMESVEKIEVRERPEPSMLSAKGKREIHAIPVGGLVEYGSYVDNEGKRHKCIVRIGSLRFSDGSQKEKGQKLVLGEAVDTEIRMPVGAMLGCNEKSARDKGAEIDETGSNSHYRWMVKGKTARQPKRKTRSKVRVAISKAEARAMLAKAIENTPVMPEIKKCPDGFPFGPTALRQLFIAGRKGKNGETGSQAWEDIAVESENKRQFEIALESMLDSDVRILADAVEAKSLAQLGEARGYKGRHAVDAGRSLLRAANDNFERALELAMYAAEG
ncbi:hypothetical protein ASD46_01335 [Rhizobium sp. Root491]|uniref:hypothetical protein n=1 Tax=Rhizobium sp. Root491 TaxID=1736548 RepID=UPI0007163D21|nr:hypothetical protein [Rhizobium sp. Root491]KQY53123.1 hypothetical protein ASD46_01335 [Rhizobium sp. Root491]